MELKPAVLNTKLVWYSNIHCNFHFFQMWILSHLHIIMVVGGLMMGAVGLSLAIGCSVCYTTNNNNKTESNEQYQPIVHEEEIHPGHSEIEVVSNQEP